MANLEENKQAQGKQKKKGDMASAVSSTEKIRTWVTICLLNPCNRMSMSLKLKTWRTNFKQSLSKMKRTPVTLDLLISKLKKN